MKLEGQEKLFFTFVFVTADCIGLLDDVQRAVDELTGIFFCDLSVEIGLVRLISEALVVP